MTDGDDVAARPLVEVVEVVRERLASGSTTIQLLVADPDHGRGRQAGSRVVVDGESLIHRPLGVWVDLAARLRLRLLTPERVDGRRIRLRLERLVGDTVRSDGSVERYGTASWFADVDKTEDAAFVLDLAEALARRDLPERPRFLFVGMNQGDEIGLVEGLLGREVEAVGVDHCPSAVAAARRRFPDARLIEADLADCTGSAYGPFDGVLALDVLHSPRVDDRAVLHDLITTGLAPDGLICIGVPNCTYLDGERLPGARTRNLTEAELSLMLKKATFYRRYLHQHGFRVFVTGQHEILVTGIRRGNSPR